MRPFTDDLLPSWYGEAAAALEFPLGWKPGLDPERWRLAGREAFRGTLIEDDAPLDPAPETHAVERREGYRVEHLSLTLGRFGRAGALLAVPAGNGPFPALLLLHDHGASFALGKEKVLRPLVGHPLAAEAQDWSLRNYDGVFVGDEAARRGWVVLAADALGWGDRALPGYEAQQALASNLFNLGSSWAGVIAVEDVAAARFLAGRPEVDRKRVAVMGHSLGSVRAWQTAALSDDVAAAVGVCSFGTVAGLMVPGGNRARGQSAYSMTHPGLSRLLDFPDVAALAAPRPLLLLGGRDDPLFPAADQERAFAMTRAVYEAFGHGERFRGELRPGGHAFLRTDQERAWEFLSSSLLS